MKTSPNNPGAIPIVLMNLSIFLLLCLAICNAPHVKGQAIHLQWNKTSINLIEQEVQKIYSSQIGIREKGINTGAAVEQYLRYVKLPKGNPWCAAFVCWVYGQAGVENPKTGWSPALFPDHKVIWGSGESRTSQNIFHAYPPSLKMPRHLFGTRNAYAPSLKTGNRQCRGIPSGQLTPNTGDLFALYFPEKKRIAHVGFIDQWDGTWLITVEGNTNVSGSSEGDGVYRKRRLVKSIYKVARYIN